MTRRIPLGICSPRLRLRFDALRRKVIEEGNP
jgi:hypothetical protein